MTVIRGRFEWDSGKNEMNVKKHGLSFEEILDVFDDPCFIERVDFEHSTLDEERLVGLGMLNGIAIITTVYTERKRTRIISARIATNEEEKRYEKWCRQFYG